MQKRIKNLLVNQKQTGVIFYLLLIGFYYITLTPAGNLRFDFLPELFESIDKVIHFLAFFVLAFFLSAYRKDMSFLQIVLSLFLVGLSIEILQHVMPYNRTFDVKDLVANSFGAIFGFLFYNKFLAKRLKIQ